MRSSTTVNTYFAILIVTIIASGAALLIVHIGTTDVAATALGNEAQFSALQNSILNK